MILVDASTLIALGQIGELELLCCFEGDIVVPPAVRAEVTTEPAEQNLERFATRDSVFISDSGIISASEQAVEMLGETERNGDVELIGLLRCWQDDADDRSLLTRENGEGLPIGFDTHQSIGLVSDDRRVRTVARSLGATVTGTIGVIVRAVEERELDAEGGKDLVRRVDSHGLHMTGELREKAYELVEDAAND